MWVGVVDTAEQSAGSGTEACRAALPLEGHRQSRPIGDHAHPDGLVVAVIVRCTAKLRALLGLQVQPPVEDPGSSSSDWYANLLHIERRKCLLVTHAGTLFSVFCPDVRAAQLRPLGPFLVLRIIGELDAEGLSERALGELDPGGVTIAQTTSGRSVLGCMNDLALTCRLAAQDAGGLGALDLAGLHHVLQRHIYAAWDYVPAIDLIPGSTPPSPRDLS